MQPVTLQVLAQSLGVVGVSRGLVEVYVSVIVSGGAHPLVHLLASLFHAFALHETVLERHDSSPPHLQAPLLGLLGEESVILRQLGHGLRAVVPDAANVVHALKDNHVGHSPLGEYVAVKALGSGGGQSAGYHAVATNAQVDDRHLAAKLLGQHVRPAVLRVGGSAAAVGDAVSQAGYAARRGGSLHFQGGDAVPVLKRLHGGKGRGGPRLARHQVGSRARATMRGGLFGSLAVVDGHREPLQGLQLVGGDVRVHRLAGLYGHRAFSVESEILGRLRLDILAAIGVGDIHRLDFHRLRALLVRQLQAELLAANAHVDDLPQGVIRHCRLGHVALRQGGFNGRCPCGRPFCLCLEANRGQQRKGGCKDDLFHSVWMLVRCFHGQK